jgi:YbbR domain-containing protein
MLRTLAQNWDLKVMAVLIAGSLWLFVVSTAKSQVALAAPVEYVGLGDDLVLVGPHRDDVKVELQAARWITARLDPASVRVRVNLGGVREGETVVQLAPDQVQAPPGVTVTRVAPAQLRLAVAPATRQKVRVAAAIQGSPAPGYVVRRVSVEPPAVEIKGPRATVKGGDVVATAPVDVSGRRASVTRTVALALPEAVYPITERTVNVVVDIRAEDEMRERGSKR